MAAYPVWTEASEYLSVKRLIIVLKSMKILVTDCYLSSGLVLTRCHDERAQMKSKFGVRSPLLYSSFEIKMSRF